MLIMELPKSQCALKIKKNAVLTCVIDSASPPNICIKKTQITVKIHVCCY